MLITRKVEFSASHVCRSPELTEEENRRCYGLAANPNGHGHNYVVEITVSGRVDPTTGMVCDLGQLDAFAQTNLLGRFDLTNLNTFAAFRDLVPTTENFTIEAHRIFRQFPGAKLERVRIEETSNNSFEYSE